MSETEVWKDVVGYEGLYEVSNHGNVRSLDRTVMVNAHERLYRKLKGNILKPTKTIGYCKVTLSKNGKQKYFNVHRLVALSFIPNPSNFPIVNHKDETRDNNNVDNLEWCTHQYNLAYGSSSKKIAKKLGKKVRGTHLVTGEVIEFPSMMEAGRNGFTSSSVSNCCNGHIESYKKYKWKFI